MRADAHPRQERRLEALRNYDILDSGREPEFEEIVRLAADICEVPMAAVSFVDANRQWFKAEIGIGIRETPLEASYCAHAILSHEDVHEISDASKDPRLSDLAFATENPFYAGAVISTPDGLPLGTLCVLDRTPRHLTELQRRTLRVLAHQIMARLELRERIDGMVVDRIVERQDDIRALDAAEIATWTVDVATGLASSSPRLRFLLGLPEDTPAWASSSLYLVALHPDDRDRVRTALDHAIETVERFDVEFRATGTDGRERIVLSRGTLSADGSLISGAMIDVTEARAAEAELRAVDARYRAAQENSPDGFMVFRSLRGEEGTIEDFVWTHANASGAAMLAHTRDELLEKRLLDVMPGNRDTVFGGYVRVVETGEPWTYELLYDRDGLDFWVRITATRVEDGFAVAFNDVTERRRAEEAAREAAENNAKFRTFFEQGSYLALLCRPDGTVVEANSRSLEAGGLTRENVLGWKAWDCGWWNRSPALMEKLRTTVLRAAGGSTYDGETAFFAADGSERWLDLTIAPVKDQAGNVILIAATGADITARKRIETNLRRSEESLRRFVDSANEGILRVGANDLIVYANDHIVEMFGYEPGAMIGMSFHDFVFEEDRPAAANRRRDREDRGLSERYESRLRGKDGQEVWVLISTVPVTEGGRYEGTYSMITDISDRKRAENGLRAGEARYRALVTAPGVVVFRTDPEGQTVASHNWEIFTGQSEAQALGTGWLEAVHPDDRAAVESGWWEGVARQEPTLSEYRVRDGAGEYRWVRGYCVPVRNESGEVTEWVGTVTDIDDHKAAQRDLHETEERRRLALDAAGLGTWGIEYRSSTLTGDERFREIFGFGAESPSFDEAVGRLHPDDREWHVKAIANAFRPVDPAPYEVEYRIVLPGGDVRWISARGRARFQEDGSGRFEGVVLDITDQRVAEGGRDDTDRRFRAAMANSPDGFMVLEAVRSDDGAIVDFAYVYVNEAGARMTERTVADYEGIRLLESYPGNAELGLFRRYVNVVESGEPFTDDIRYDRDGLDVYVRAAYIKVGDGFAVTFSDLSDRRRAAEELRRSEERYRTLFNSIDEGFCVVEPLCDASGRWYDYRFLELNPAFTRFSGLPPETAGRTIRECVPGIEDIWAETYGRVLETGISERLEHEAAVMNRYFEVNASRVGTREDGQVAIVFSEISERITAEHERERLVAALTVEREKLSELFEQTPAFLALLSGPEFLFEYANPEYRELMGYRELVGRKLREAIPEAIEQGFGTILDRVYGSGEAFVGRELVFDRSATEHSAGKTVHVDFVFQPMRDAKGDVNGILIHGVEVTEQVSARRAIAESQEQFRTVFENAPDDAIIVMDEDMTITAWNPAAERICGWTSEEAVGQKASLFFTPEDVASGAYEREIVAAKLHGKAIDERWHMHSDGSRFWGSGTLNALFHPDGAVRGYLKVFRDATERHETEKRSIELKEELERMVAERTTALVAKNEELEGFTYSVSHDMRAPLRAIVSRARMVLEEEGPSVSPSGRQDLERLARAASQMAQLVDDLLQYARLGKRELRRETVGWADLVTEVAAQVRADRPECALEVTVTGDGELSVDPRVLGMALHNLLDNSCKYRKAGAAARVEATFEVREEGPVFSLRDEGIGFDMQYVGKLFQPFERLHREEYVGTGIGLANVRRAIERHGGRVWAEGEVGVGTKISFTLG